MIAGLREARTEFKALLPPEARKLLAGEGAVPMQMAGNELARRLRGLDHASEVA